MRPNQIAANLGAVRPWSDPVLDKHCLMELERGDLSLRIEHVPRFHNPYWGTIADNEGNVRYSKAYPTLRKAQKLLMGEFKMLADEQRS